MKTPFSKFAKIDIFAIVVLLISIIAAGGILCCRYPAIGARVVGEVNVIILMTFCSIGLFSKWVRTHRC